MVKRTAKLYVHDILESIEKIEDYTKGLTFQEFSKDRLVIDAVVRNLGIIGEATKHIPQDLRSLDQHIPWKEIAGMRDKITHEYFGVDLEIIWKTISGALPDLKRSIKGLLKRIS